MIETFHIAVLMKPTDGNFVSNAKKHGVAGINVAACRVGTEEMAVTKSNGEKVSDNVSMGGHNTGRIECGTVEGRWPTNVVHDGCEKVVECFPEVNNTRHMSYKRSGGDFIGGIPSQEEKGWFERYSGSAARFFYQVNEFEEDE